MRKYIYLTALISMLCHSAFGQIIGTETEPNDSKAQANLMVLGTYAANEALDTGCHLSHATGTPAADYYKVSLPSSGVLLATIPVNSVGVIFDFEVIDSATNTMINKSLESSPAINEALICSAGTYYIFIGAYSGSPSNSPYSLHLVFYPDATECNETFATASNVNGNDTIQGQIFGKYYNTLGYKTPDKDIYKFHNDDCSFLTAIIPMNTSSIAYSITITDSATLTSRPTVSGTIGSPVIDTATISPGAYYVTVATASSSDTDPYLYTLYLKLTGCTTGVTVLNGSQRQITVYPNPSNGLFTVTLPESWEAATITITNMMGAKLWQTTTVQGKEDIQLDQPVGIYFLTVESSKGKSVQKIIINQ